MSRAVKGTIVTAVALIAIAASASAASAASLKVTAPTRLSRSKPFNVIASGKGNFAKNYLALFVSKVKCKSTYAGEVRAGGRRLVAGFVGRTFRVRLLHNAKGGSPGTAWLCTYLYPKASGSAWALKPPEAKNSHKITWT
jgi:hypothetical protein